MVTACIWNYNRLLFQNFVLFWTISLICIRLRDFALKIRKIHEIDFIAEQFADWFDCVSFVETYCWNVDICMSDLSQKLWKAAHDSQIPPRNLTANLSLQLLQNLALRSSSKKFMKNFTYIFWTTQLVYLTGSTRILKTLFQACLEGYDK